MLKELIKELENLKKIDLFDKKNHLFILNKLKDIRNCITTSGYFGIEEDYMFNISKELKRDINYREDLISKLVTTYNKVRAYIISNIINQVRKYKKFGKNEDRLYYIESFFNKIPGKIKCKDSILFFRYFNDNNLEEIEKEIIPEIEISWDNKGLRERLLFLHLHKILLAYLFINFSGFVINRSSTNSFCLSRILNKETVCLKKISSLLYYSSYNRSLYGSIENTIEKYVMEISNIVNLKLDKNISCLVYQYGNSKYLYKILSVFVSPVFNDFVSNYFYKTETSDRYINNKIDKSIEKLYTLVNEGQNF